MTAALILVVGPSGAGKDSLIEGARTRLPDMHFARRVVTRPAQAGAEVHDTLDLDDFERQEACGAFMLSWRAHGLAYGVPASLDRIRAEGTAIVVNASRAIIDDARKRLSPVGIIVVTAPADVLAARLAARGRERAEDVRRRLERAAAVMPEGPDVRTVVNDGDLEAGISAFVAALGDFA